MEEGWVGETTTTAAFGEDWTEPLLAMYSAVTQRLFYVLWLLPSAVLAISAARKGVCPSQALVYLISRSFHGPFGPVGVLLLVPVLLPMPLCSFVLYPLLDLIRGAPGDAEDAGVSSFAWCVGFCLLALEFCRRVDAGNARARWAFEFLFRPFLPAGGRCP
jgi:hypothetical protein